MFCEFCVSFFLSREDFILRCCHPRTCLADCRSTRFGRVVDLLVALLWSGREITGESLRKLKNCHRACCHLIDSHRHRSIHTRVVHTGRNSDSHSCSGLPPASCNASGVSTGSTSRWKVASCRAQGIVCVATATR